MPEYNLKLSSGDTVTIASWDALGCDLLQRVEPEAGVYSLQVALTLAEVTSWKKAKTDEVYTDREFQQALKAARVLEASTAPIAIAICNRIFALPYAQRLRSKEWDRLARLPDDGIVAGLRAQFRSTKEGQASNGFADNFLSALPEKWQPLAVRACMLEKDGALPVYSCGLFLQCPVIATTPELTSVALKSPPESSKDTKVLGTLSTLTSLDLRASDIEKPEHVLQLAPALGKLTGLRNVDLGFNDLTGFDSVGGGSVCPWMAPPSASKEETEAATKAMATLGRALAKITALERLSFEYCDLDCDHLAAVLTPLKKAVNLRTLNVSSNRFARGGAAALAKALDGLKSVTAVDVSARERDCMDRNPDHNAPYEAPFQLPAILKGFAGMSALEEVTMHNHVIKDDSIVALCGALKGAKGLRKINMHGCCRFEAENAMGTAAAEALAGLIRAVPEVQEIKLGSDFGVGDHGVALLKAVAEVERHGASKRPREDDVDAGANKRATVYY